MIYKRIVSLIYFMSVFFLQHEHVWALSFSEAKLTVHVIDEQRQPVAGARVGFGFEENTGWGTKEIPVIGFTDSGGFFAASAKTSNSVGFNVKKDGYYMSYGDYRYNEKKFGRWQPWNPEVTVVLRKIEKPLPMYARDTQMSGLEIPVAGKEVGFDLVAYDWTAPFGKGKYADFIFTLDKTILKEDDFDCTLTVTFSNKYDGIQLAREEPGVKSVFKLPRTAPESGYQAKLIHWIKRSPGKPITHDFEGHNNYLFRVRSEEKNGKLVRSLYGKIHGDIEFYPLVGKTARIHFRYFLNPDYTRNLEFDPSRNLFENLRSTERVGLE
jgi:hypothetical protein